MAKSKASKKPEREIVYPEIKSKVCIGEKACTVEDSMRILGWCTDEKIAKQHKLDEHHLVVNGEKVWLLHNLTNRPITKSNYEGLVQEHLRKKWRFNGEPTIIGQYASVLNGQHTHISHVLAEYERLKSPSSYDLDGPITMERAFVFGIEEDDEIINTMDTCRPRSLADVIYRSPFFSHLGASDRKKSAMMTDHAIRFMWDRTRTTMENAWAPRRTHSEAIDMLNRHPKLLECVKHINDEDDAAGGEDGGRTIGSYIRLGVASGLMYLMASSATKDAEEVYHVKSDPSEKHIDFKHWEKACEFWVLFSKGEEFKSVKRCIANLAKDGDDGIDVKSSVFAYAWELFLKGKAIKGVGDVKPTIKVNNETGAKTLVSPPSFGGIDLGIRENVPAVRPNAEPTPQEQAEIEARKQEEEARHTEKNGDTPPVEPTPAPKAKPKPKAKDKSSSKEGGNKGEQGKAGNHAPPVVPPTDELMKQELNELHAKHPDTLLLRKTPLGHYAAWEKDAEDAASCLEGRKAYLHVNKLTHFVIKDKELEECLKEISKKYRVGILDNGDIRIVEKMTDTTPTTPAPTPENGKPSGKKKPTPKKAPETVSTTSTANPGGF